MNLDSIADATSIFYSCFVESKLKEMTKENPIASADNLSRPLLSKSAVLRMLSEFVKSYPSCANIVVQHSYMAGQTDSVNEVTFYQSINAISTMTAILTEINLKSSIAWAY